MSFKDCLKEARQAGEIGAQDEKRLNQVYEALIRENAADGADKAIKALEQLKKRLRAEAKHKRYKLFLTLQSLDQIKADIKLRDQVKKKPDVADAAIDLLSHNGNAPFSSAEGLQNSIVGQAHAKLEGLLFEFRKSAVLGDNLSIGKARFNFRHGKARLENVVSELFGKGTGDDAAKGLAQAWTETAEWLRRRFNAAGGAIGKLENWGLPQSHDALALRKAGFETWKRTIRNMLDVDRMLDPLTGTKLLPEQLDDALESIYNAIVTDGWMTREPKRQAFGAGALSNQHAEHRFLVFKDPESWLEYQRLFGEGDPFSAMMRHVNIMARDIAHMERLGPNPNATVEWLKQSITKEAQLAAAGKPARWKGRPSNALNRAGDKVTKVDAIWSDLRGSLNTPTNARRANTFDGLRNIVTSSILGQAALSAISDTGSGAIARAFAGLPATRTLTDIVAQMSRGSRRDAVAAGLILDGAAHTFSQQARYAGSLAGPQWTAYLTDRVLTWQGLTPWTQAGKHAHGQAYQRMVVNARGVKFDELPGPFRAQLSRWGFQSADWDALRVIKPHEGLGGAEFLRPQDVAAVNQGLADRYLEMILQDTEFAVPSSTARSRALFTGAGQRGTWWGEIQRSFLMFKSFGAVFAVLNTLRVVDIWTNGGNVGKAAGAGYASALLISMTLFGALSMQLKQIANGRDPRPMEGKEFWGAAMLQGGGLGIYGDFLFADVNRYGGGFHSTLGGPLIEHLSDAWTLTGGNAIELASGKTWEETKAGREFVKFLKGNTPVVGLWWGRLGYERVLLDSLQYMVDPEANEAFKRREKFWQRNMGQEFFWRPGHLTPDRAPDLSSALP